MTTVLLRQVAGRPLTNAEVDSNFQNLNEGKAEAAHPHAVSDVDGLAASLSSKAELAGANFTGPVVFQNAVPKTAAAPLVNEDITNRAFVIAQDDLVKAQIAALAAVAASGSYNDLVNKPDLTLKADLVAGKVPANQLPSFVDDVLEYANVAAFPATGESGKQYVAINSANAADPSKVYRWSGTVYTEISPSPGSTTDVPEGTNLYFTAPRAAAAAPVQSVAGNVGAVSAEQIRAALPAAVAGGNAGLLSGSDKSKVDDALTKSGNLSGITDAAAARSALGAAAASHDHSAADVQFTPAGTGATAITTEAKLRQTVCVSDYGYDDAAFTKAFSTGAKLIRVPAGNYTTTGTLNITASGVTLIGDGPEATIITSSATGPAINVASGLTGVCFKDLQITRTPGTAAAGDSGIKFTTLTEQALVSNVKLSRHWIGLDLCATSYSFVEKTLVLNNYSHGVQVANNASYAGLQWSFLKCLSQTNDGYGLLYTTAAGAAGASVGDIDLFSTYANKLGGVKFAGTATSPINAIRWFGGFVGEDGGHGMELDTYGVSNHKIEGLFSEIAGTSGCGVGLSTAATNVGNGILVTENNTWVDLIACEVVGNSHTGIVMSASRFSIVGCSVRLNGAANAAGQKNGIRILAGQGSITGGCSKGHASFGVYLGVDTVSVVGVDVRENTTSGIAGASIVNSPVIGNIGSSVINYGTTDIGWAAMTGTGNKSTVYDVATVTTAQLAGRVKQLEDALLAVRIIST